MFILKKAVIPFLIVCLLSAQAFAQLENADVLYQQGRQARVQHDWAKAKENLEAALKLAPGNADILVQLGLTYMVLGELDLAQDMFKHALVIAPNYLDAYYGLATIAYWQGDLLLAQQMVGQAIAGDPKYTDALTLQHNIEQAIKNLPKKWRLDVYGDYSNLSKGYRKWKDGNYALSYTFKQKTTLTGELHTARRFSKTDNQVLVTVAHRFNDAVVGYFKLGGTPNADFLPENTVATGGSLKVRQGNKGIGTTLLTFDLKHDEYSNGGVQTLTPGIDQYLFSNKFILSLRVINVFQQEGRYAGGYMIRTSLEVTPRFSFYVGQANALEPSDNKMIRTKSAFGGISFRLTENFILKTGYTHELKKNTYKRNILGAGFTWLF